MALSLAVPVLASVDGEAVTVVVVVALVVVALGAASLVKPFTSGPGRTGTARPRRTIAPMPFSYWYALVPFEDGTGAKERPVLVLRTDGTSAQVLRVTSKTKTGRPNYRRIDTSRWDRPGQRDGSWLQTDKVVTVPLAGFRRCLGTEHDTHLERELADMHPRFLRRPDGDQTSFWV